jgi:hypothetical protein
MFVIDTNPFTTLSMALLIGAGLLFGSPAKANESRCFGEDVVWCAWTVPESNPEKGWGAVAKVRLRSLVVETVIDAQDNLAALRVHVSPVTASEKAKVNLSIRHDSQDWQEWQNFNTEYYVMDSSIARFKLDRSALEALIEADPTAFLYVFVEVMNGTNNHKVSHKIGLSSLEEALRFARTGR